MKDRYQDSQLPPGHREDDERDLVELNEPSFTNCCNSEVFVLQGEVVTCPNCGEPALTT